VSKHKKNNLLYCLKSVRRLDVSLYQPDLGALKCSESTDICCDTSPSCAQASRWALHLRATQDGKPRGPKGAHQHFAAPRGYGWSGHYEFEFERVRCVSFGYSQKLARAQQTNSKRLERLNYAPEISGAMLRRQAAQALVDARHLIVKGAVDIAREAVANLEAGGMRLSDEEKFKLVSSLLVVSTSDRETTPTLNL